MIPKEMKYNLHYGKVKPKPKKSQNGLNDHKGQESETTL